MSGLRRRGDKARMVSPVVSTNDAFCLEFWYHMQGSHVGTLNVYRQVCMNMVIFTEFEKFGLAMLDLHITVNHSINILSVYFLIFTFFNVLCVTILKYLTLFYLIFLAI